jgi:hypothetical protein
MIRPSSQRPSLEPLRLQYPLAPGVYDEMFEAPGVPRRGWAPLVRGLGELGPEQMARRWEQARRLIRETASPTTSTAIPRGWIAGLGACCS